MSKTLEALYTDYVSFVSRLASPSSTQTLKTMMGTAGLGLAGEAGEIEEIVSEVLSGTQCWSRVVRDDLIKELGDMMWYITFAGRYVTGQTLISDFVLPSGEFSLENALVGDPNTNLRFGATKLVVATSKFSDIIKKQLFHGVSFTKEIIDKLGWCLSEAFFAVMFIADSGLGCDLNEIIQKNMDKLRARYENLEFSTEASIAKADEKVV